MSAEALYLDRQLCFRLYACSRAMTKAYQPMLNELGVTYPQYLVLMVLWQWADEGEQNSSVKHLGERLQLDSGTLTPLLKRMEAASFLVRVRDDVDERRVMVRLTEAGLSLRLKALPWIEKMVDERGEHLDFLESLNSDLGELLEELQR